MKWTNDIDKIKVSSLILNVVLLILLCLSGMVMRIPCPDQWVNQVVQIDTIRPADVPVKIAEGKPVVRKYVRMKLPKVDKSNNIDKFAVSKNSDNISSTVNAGVALNAPANSPEQTSVINASVYSDTLYQVDNYRAIINDTVNGEIIGRSVWFVNLKPEVKTTITNTVLKKEKVKFYLGAMAQCNNQAKWGVGPSAIVTIPGAIAISYGYNIMQGLHTAIIAAPIQFGRRKN